MNSFIVIDFAASRAKIDQKIEAYNLRESERLARAGLKHGGEFVRLLNREFCYALIRLARIQLYQAQKSSGISAEADSLPPITVNNQTLSKWLKVHPTTIWRYRQRLVKAGILTGYVNHGTRQDYELRFAEGLLVIQEASFRTQKSPVATILESPSDAASTELIANRKPTLSILPETKEKNKTLLKCAKVSESPSCDISRPQQHPCSDLPKTFATVTGDLLTGNKRPQAGAGAAADVAPQSELEAYREKVARADISFKQAVTVSINSLISSVIALLYAEWQFYGSYLQQLSTYLATHYYGNVHTWTELARRNELHHSMLTLAADYSMRHPEYRPPHPMMYFNVNNNSNGFQALGKWLKTRREWDKLKESSTSRKARDHEELLRIVRQFQFHPDLAQFRRCEAEVKRKVPHLLETFLRMVAGLETSQIHHNSSQRRQSVMNDPPIIENMRQYCGLVNSDIAENSRKASQ